MVDEKTSLETKIETEKSVNSYILKFVAQFSNTNKCCGSVLFYFLC